MHQPLISIPIYRCSKEQYDEEIAKDRKISKDRWLAVNPPESCTNLTQDEYRKIMEDFVNRIPNLWQYNQIIGYISIYVFCSKIKAELWYTTKQKIRKGITYKDIRYKAYGLLDISTEYLTNEQVFDRLIEDLEKIKEQYKSLKNRHIDLSELKSFGPFIDWKSFISEHYSD